MVSLFATGSLAIGQLGSICRTSVHGRKEEHGEEMVGTQKKSEK